LPPIIKTATLKPALVPLFGPLSDHGLLKNRQSYTRNQYFFSEISHLSLFIFLCILFCSYFVLCFCTTINF